MNLLKINSVTGKISLDGVELPYVSDLQLNVKSGDLCSATITFDCNIETVLAIDGHVVWASDITASQVDEKNMKLVERIKSLISMLIGN